MPNRKMIGHDRQCVDSPLSPFAPRKQRYFRGAKGDFTPPFRGLRWLFAVALSCCFAAGSPVAGQVFSFYEEPPGSADAIPSATSSATSGSKGTGTGSTLHLASGDYLAGELCGCDQAGTLRWQGAAFAAPLDFPLSAVSGISFPAGRPAPAAGPHPDSPYCLELGGGDALFGTLVGLSSQEIQFDAPGLGLLHVQRSAVQSLSHSRKSGDLIYLGPNGLLDWKASPDGAWEQDAGRPFTNRDEASLVDEFDIPAQVCIDFELSWTSQPDFSVILGAGAGRPKGLGTALSHIAARMASTKPSTPQEDPAFRLEVWDRQLVLLRETPQKADLVSLQKIASGAGRCHFRIYLDQEHNRAIVFAADGSRLAELAIADGPKHFGTSLKLVNHHGNVRLEELCILRWDGQPPRPVQNGKSRIQRTDGSAESGEITGFDADTKEFLITDAVDSESKNTAAADRKSRIAADAVERIVLSSTKSQPMSGLRAISASGNRLSGDLRKTENGRLWLSRPGIVEPLGIDLSALRSLVVLDSPKPPPAPEGRIGRLEGDGVKLEGCLVAGSGSAGANCLIWRPTGSTTASRLKQEFSGQIVYRDASSQRSASPPTSTAPGAGVVMVNGGVFIGANVAGVVNIRGRRPSNPAASAGPWSGPAMYLRTGDTIACEVKRIDERGVTFKSRLFDATFVPHDKVKAVQLDRSQATKIDFSKRDRLLTLPRMQKDDPPTHLIRSTEGDYLRGRLVEMDDKSLTIEVRLETRHVPRDQVASIIWLDKAAKQPSAGDKPAGHDVPAAGEKATPDGKPAGGEKVASDEKPPAGEKPGAGSRRGTREAGRGARTPAPNSLLLAPRSLLPTRVQSLASDGLRLTFQPEKLVGNTLQGTSDVLGACRVNLSEVDKLIIGRAIEQEAQSLPYQRWNLQPAIEPKFAQGSGNGTPGIESELVGKLAPDFELDTLDGQKFRLSDQRKKIVVLDFFATWCGPCMQTLPQLVPAMDKYRDRNVVMLAVNIQEAPEAITATLSRLQLKAAVGLDRNGVVAEKYAAVAIPQTVIIDGDGKVARLFIGGGPQYVDELCKALEAVLTPAAGQAKSP